MLLRSHQVPNEPNHHKWRALANLVPRTTRARVHVTSRPSSSPTYGGREVEARVRRNQLLIPGSRVHPLRSANAILEAQREKGRTWRGSSRNCDRTDGRVMFARDDFKTIRHKETPMKPRNWWVRGVTTPQWRTRRNEIHITRRGVHNSQIAKN